LLAGGGYAELVAAHERMLMPVPDRMTLEDVFTEITHPDE